MEVEAERIAAHSTEWTMPCFWVTAEEFPSVDTAFQSDPTVETIVETREFEHEKYYHVEWSATVIERIDAYVDRGGSVLNAWANGEGWRVRFRFAERDQFDAFHDHLEERGHAFELRNVTEPGAPRQMFGEMTPRQRDALVVALEHGYYEVPREIASEELAEKLDITQQALSERLQRGMRNLINSTLTTDDTTTQVG